MVLKGQGVNPFTAIWASWIVYLSSLSVTVVRQTVRFKDCEMINNSCIESNKKRSLNMSGSVTSLKCNIVKARQTGPISLKTLWHFVSNLRNIEWYLVLLHTDAFVIPALLFSWHFSRKELIAKFEIVLILFVTDINPRPTKEGGWVVTPT